MSLLAIQQHTQQLLAGLTTPQLVAQGVGPANAFIAPPSVTTDTMTDPEIYVWDSRLRNIRQTAPRNTLGAADWRQPAQALPALPVTSAGFRSLTWHITIWIMMLLPAGEDNVTYPLLVDTVLKQLSLDLMPVMITDPQTQDQSQMTHFAEEIEMEFPVPQETADERILLYSQALTVKVEEKVQI